MSDVNNFNRLPPLKSLKGFEATVRLGGVVRAADELNITPPAITHQIHNLEQSLGVDLFIRGGQKLILTEAGKTFYPFVYQALTEVKEGLAALQSISERPELLRVQTYVTAAIRWLATRLARFQQERPDILIKLDSSSPNWHFDYENSDVGLIFLREPPDKKYAWHPLFPCEVAPLCTPELLATFDHTIGPESLLHAPLISVHTEELHWETWLESVGVKSKGLNPVLTVDTLAVALEMARNSEGVVLSNGPFAQREIERGLLVYPFEQKLVMGDWGIIYPKNSPKLDQISALIGFLEKAL
ncbi:MAG: LysR family glycine cleavage system transcriptional activator [Cocleimonas sp.]|jgi:LysR family glycine cleavage system transcriptional activator